MVCEGQEWAGAAPSWRHPVTCRLCSVHVRVCACVSVLSVQTPDLSSYGMLWPSFESGASPAQHLPVVSGAELVFCGTWAWMHLEFRHSWCCATCGLGCIKGASEMTLVLEEHAYFCLCAFLRNMCMCAHAHWCIFVRACVPLQAAAAPASLMQFWALLCRLLLHWMCGIVCQLRYSFVWLLSEASLTFMGLNLKGWDEKERPIW